MAKTAWIMKHVLWLLAAAAIAVIVWICTGAVALPPFLRNEWTTNSPGSITLGKSYASNIVSGGQLPSAPLATNTPIVNAVLIGGTDNGRRWDMILSISNNVVEIQAPAGSTNPTVRVRGPTLGPALTIGADGGVEIVGNLVVTGTVNSVQNGQTIPIANLPIITPSDGIALQNFADTNTGGFGWNGPGVTISNVTFAASPAGFGGTETIMRMTGVGEYQRRLAWSNNWQRMKMAILVRIPTNAPFGADKFGATNVQFFLGVVSGTNTFCTTSNIQNAVGAGVGMQNASFHILTSNTIPRSVEFRNAFSGYSGTNGEWTSQTMSAGSGNNFVAADIGAWSMFFIELSKPWGSQTNSVTFTGWLTAWRYSDIPLLANYRNLVVEAYARDSTTPSLDLAIGNMGTLSFTYSEGLTSLDTIAIYWRNTNNVPLEIGGIMASRIY